MSRPDIEAIRDRVSVNYGDPTKQVEKLLTHIDALEAALRAAVGRCHRCSTAFTEEMCPDCRAALALLDGSGE